MTKQNQTILPQMSAAIRAQHDLTSTEIDELEQRLYEHNRDSTGYNDALGLAFVIRECSGRIVGAIAGYTWARTSEIRQLWVDEAYRGRGYGEGLITAFCAEAERRRIHQIWVMSFDFQAPALYERLGFDRVIELQGWPAGHSHIVLRKTFAKSDE